MKHSITTAIFVALLSVLQAQIGVELNLQPGDCFCEGTPQQPFMVTAEGSAGPFTYEWSSPNGYFSTAKEPDDIVLGGDYTLEVYNAYACSFSHNVILEACTGPQFQFTQNNCIGEIELHIEEGTPPFSVNWFNHDTGESIGQSGTTITVGDGAYFAEVTDGNGCIWQTQVIEMELDSAPLELEAIVNSVTCANATDGSITIHVSNGIPEYSFNWFVLGADSTPVPVSVSDQSSNILEQVAMGLYNVFVEDQNGCGGFLLEIEVGQEPIIETQPPFITQAKVFAEVQGAPKLIYQGDWQDNGEGCFKLKIQEGLDVGQEEISAIQQGANLTINVFTNVPMDWMTVSLPSTTAFGLGVTAFPGSGQSWSFDLGSVPEISMGSNGIEQILSFAGMDNSGNALPLLSPIALFDNTENCFEIPVQQPDCSWMPPYSTGDDDSHVIFISGCNGLTDPISSICPIITPVSECGLSDGSIVFRGSCSFGGELPYTYEWTNGATTLNVSNLSGGHHALTVTDAIGCQGTFEYFVPSYGEPLVDQSQTSVVNSCSGQNNGRIIVALALVDPDNSGNEPPIDASFEWSNGVTVQNDVFSIQESLSPGTYTVTITNLATQCSIVEDFTVQEVTSDAPLNVTAETLGDICYESSGGSVKLTITGGIPPYYRNGAEISGSILQINQQYTEGQHCETITDHCGESYQVCFEIEVIESSIFSIFLADIDHVSSSGADDGSASISVAPDGDYSFQWLPYSEFLGTNLSVDGLEVGDYKVRVEDNLSGCTEVLNIQIQECIDVPDFDVSLFGGFIDPDNPDDPVVFYASVQKNGEPPLFDPSTEFTIQWKVNGTPIDYDGYQLNADPSLLHNATYPTVQIAVDNGCVVKYKSIEVYNCEDDAAAIDFFVANEQKPCASSSDGEIQIVVPNIFLTSTPENLSVEVVISGVHHLLELTPYAEGRAFSATVGGLAEGFYPFIVNVGANCQATFTYPLYSSDPEPVYDRYEDEIEPACIYKEYCGEGEEIGEYSVMPFLDTDNPDGQNCRIPILCDGNIVGYDEYGIITCRVAEYKGMLLNMLWSDPQGYGFTSQYLLTLLDHVTMYRDCGKIKYCRATLDPTLVFGSNLLGNIIGSYETENGCTRYRCLNPFGNFTSCADENCSLPPVLSLQDPPDPPGGCQEVVSFNLYGLLEAMNSGTLYENGNFYGSELEHELMGYQPIQDPDETKCVEVVFCKDNFEFKYFSPYTNAESLCENVDVIQYEPIIFDDINELDDWDFLEDEDIVIPTCEVVSTIQNENGDIIQEIVRCRSSACDDFSTVSAHDDCTTEHIIDYLELYDIFGIDNGFAPSDTLLYFLQDDYGAERLRSLSMLTSDGVTIPKPVIDASLDRRVLYDYTPTSTGSWKREEKGLISKIENWDTHQSLHVFEETQGISVSYSDSITTWLNYLHSTPDSTLRIQNVALSENGFIQVAGEFEGSLSWGEENLAFTSLQSLFILQLDYEGQVVDIDVVEISGLSGKESTLNFDKEGKGIFLVGLSPTEGGSIFINGSTLNNIPTFNTNGFGMLKWDPQSGFFSTLKFLDIGEQSRLFSANEKNGNTIIAVKNAKTNGLSESESENKIEILGDQESSALVYLNTDGEVIWAQDILGDEIYNIEAMPHEDGTIVLGVTFSGKVVFGGQEFVANGGLDVLILRLLPNGDLLSYNLFGSADNETVEVMFINSGILYFGGHFYGGETTRYIGNKIFKDLSPFGPEVYMSELFLDQPQMAIAEEPAKKDIFVPKTLEDQLNLTKVFPNPSSGEIHLSIFADESQQQVQLEMTDMTGKMVENWGRLPIEKGSNNLSLTPSPSIGPGAYLLKIVPVNQPQQTIVTKIIRL